jgi:hypothetical protein
MLTRHAYIKFSKISLISTVFLIVLVLLAGCSSTLSGASTTPTVQSKPSPTAGIASGTVLYKADWSKGLSNWQVVGGWKIEQNELRSDMGSGNLLTLPYTPSTPNYSLEVRIKLLEATSGGSYDFVTQPGSDKDGYTIGVTGLFPNGHEKMFAIHPSAQVVVYPREHQTNDYVTIDYEPGNDWVIYRIDVRGISAGFYADNHRVSNANSTKPFSTGPIQLRSIGAMLAISDLTIKAL